jgi:hypothetical protein
MRQEPTPRSSVFARTSSLNSRAESTTTECVAWWWLYVEYLDVVGHMNHLRAVMFVSRAADGDGS